MADQESSRVVREVRGDDVAPRLADLGPGLTRELLEDVIRAGETARSNASTPFHPRNGAGFSAYNERTFMLRMKLFSHGWLPEDPKGAPVIVHPDKHLQIVVATGDERTGSRLQPRTQYRKGPSMSGFVSENAQMPLVFKGWNEELSRIDDKVVSLIEADTRRVTYCLFVYRDSPNLVRAELSRPEEIEDGFPIWCSERVFLDQIDISPDEGDSGSDDDNDSGEIVVPITRR